MHETALTPVASNHDIRNPFQSAVSVIDVCMPIAMMIPGLHPLGHVSETTSGKKTALTT